MMTGVAKVKNTKLLNDRPPPWPPSTASAVQMGRCHHSPSMTAPNTSSVEIWIKRAMLYLRAASNKHMLKNRGLQKGARIHNAPVHVRLRGVVYHSVKSTFRQNVVNDFRVGNITLHKTIARVVGHRRHVGRITGISQFVQIDDPPIRVLSQHQTNKI